eukprot:1178541-Prorocentrum_minimum.AAC.4
MGTLRFVLVLAGVRWALNRVLRLGDRRDDDIKKNLSKKFSRIVVDHPRQHGREGSDRRSETSGRDSNHVEGAGSRDIVEEEVVRSEGYTCIDAKRADAKPFKSGGDGSDVVPAKKCAVCWNASREVRLSCGHSLTCRKCTVELQKPDGKIACPVCRSSEVSVMANPTQKLDPDVLERTGKWQDGAWNVGRVRPRKDQTVDDTREFNSLLEAAEHWAQHNTDHTKGEVDDSMAITGSELPSLKNMRIQFGNVQTADFNQTFVPTGRIRPV